MVRCLPRTADTQVQRVNPLYRSEATRLSVSLSGVGAQAAAVAATELLDRDFGALILCGFCAGLVEDLPAGSIAIAECVRDNRGNTFTPDLGLLAATADRVLNTSAEKRALAARTQAIATDMETAGAAQVAQERGARWLAVRAVSDDLYDTLPFDFNALADAAGNISYGRVIGAALTHPWKIPALIRLGQRSSLAANHLTRFLLALSVLQ